MLYHITSNDPRSCMNAWSYLVAVEKLIRIVSHVRILVEHVRRGESFEIDLIHPRSWAC